MFYQKRVLKKFAKFTGKHLYQSLFLINFQVEVFHLLQKRLWHLFFIVNFAKFLGTPYRTPLHDCSSTDTLIMNLFNLEWGSRQRHPNLKRGIFRSRRLEVFFKKGALRNFAKFTGKHLCQSLFFNKVAGQETLAQVISCEFCEISKNTFSYRTTPVAASVYFDNIHSVSQGNLTAAPKYLYNENNKNNKMNFFCFKLIYFPPKTKWKKVVTSFEELLILITSVI